MSAIWDVRYWEVLLYLYRVTFFVHLCVLLLFNVTFWSSGEVVITTTQFHSTKP